MSTSTSSTSLPSVVKGQVVAAHANFMRVVVDPQEVPSLGEGEPVELLCVVRAVLKKIKCRILVGDFVLVGRIDWSDRRGAVVELLPRENSALEPPVANVDRVLVLFAFTDPPIDLKQLTLFLVCAEVRQLPLPVLLVLNKSDLLPSKVRKQWRQRIAGWGYEARELSLLSGEGAQELAAELRRSVTVLMGPSGTGKSSLVNTLRRQAEAAGLRKAQGAVDLATQEVSARSGRGRHTTRHCELLQLPEGALVADTPGFGFPTKTLANMVPETLVQCFPEVRRALKANGPCSFSNCKHTHEPGCSVGRNWDRHAIYAAMMENAKEAERKRRHQGQGKAQQQAGMRLKSAKGGATRAEPKLQLHIHRRLSRRRQHMLTQATAHEEGPQQAGDGDGNSNDDGDRNDQGEGEGEGDDDGD
eukprot:GGOE01000253.1.p1 GENE.GGOE01000253.1~~GGOE01000253.1.p1  ORF type:complete len:472 (+),score=116.84 GGOE01000253.1:169-1416(+)